MKKTRIDSIRDTDGRRLQDLPILKVLLFDVYEYSEWHIYQGDEQIGTVYSDDAQCFKALEMFAELGETTPARQAIQKPRCVAEAAGEICKRAEDGFPHSHWPR